MTRDGEGTEEGEALLRLRAPVSERFWRDYGVVVAFVAAALLAVALFRAESVGEGVTFAAVFLGLSLAAVLAGLVVYNLVVAVLLATGR